MVSQLRKYLVAFKKKITLIFTRVGFTYRKLSQYSPNDTSKAFDRQVNRRNNVKFNPRQTIEILKLGEPPAQLNDKQKLDLVKKYMEV